MIDEFMRLVSDFCFLLWLSSVLWPLVPWSRSQWSVVPQSPFRISAFQLFSFSPQSRPPSSALRPLVPESHFSISVFSMSAFDLALSAFQYVSFSAFSPSPAVP